MAKKRKGIWESPAKRDDPIYKEGLTIFTPALARPKKMGNATFHGLNKRPAHLPRIGSQVIFNPKRKR